MRVWWVAREAARVNLGDDDFEDQFDAADEGELEPDVVALRASIAPEVRSLIHWTGIDRASFNVSATEQDVEHAKALLAEQGMIPASDLAGHRGAVQMWRDHCAARREDSLQDLLTDVQQVLSAPRPVPPTCGTRGEPVYAWIRPDDIPVTTDSNFPYHYTAAGLAELARNLIAEGGHPAGLDKILGFNFVLDTTSTPRGPVHCVTVNGNHRAAALRAAGFPVALAQITVQREPWEIPVFAGSAEPLYRLLFRAGLLTNYRRRVDDWSHEDLVDAGGIAPWLLDTRVIDVIDPEQARTNLLAYEAAYGAVDDPRVDWIRRRRTFQRILRRESMTITEHGPDLLPGLAGDWPPRPTLAQRAEYWLLPR
ncbi:hypothetical protein [Kribbella sp. NBC_00889]|uniref:hypothetical protein n=1 Tax=Kribbella sp. NBC_00889 TaxID=2975974 RepID=UPI003870BC44|nr:hypothetical protein OG817_31470 [Kribbella sp. NBC_00889]